MDNVDNVEKQDASGQPEAERRKFLASCGRFAIVTPPALTVLMSTSLTSHAIANRTWPIESGKEAKPLMFNGCRCEGLPIQLT